MHVIKHSISIVLEGFLETPHVWNNNFRPIQLTFLWKFAFLSYFIINTIWIDVPKFKHVILLRTMLLY